MDRRSWPWKKRLSDTTTETKVTAPDSVATSLGSPESQGYQYTSRKENYIQISVESYTRLTELAGQAKTLGDEVNTINEKLSSANSEITTKENIVKQHAKVAEDAISGWERAEAEASALKQQLESVTDLKLTAEDRALHLDGALIECMRQIRSMKEEHEQKLHEIVFTQTELREKNKLEFEKKIVNLNQELHSLSAENAALSRTLQERSDMIMKISEEKSQAEAEIEILKTDIESYEREASSLKYELHIVSKELEIRNEEKNMSLRSAEVANKQHLEDVKKLSKLEAECQRLRSLVRKKLPGPAALAQMKLEVENLGRDYGETRVRRSPSRSSSTHLSPLPEFSHDNMQQYHQEVQFLMERLLATEEETKMLKEALAKRNTELQASRSMLASMASKLQRFEAELKVLNQNKSSGKSVVETLTEDPSSQIASYPSSLVSISEEVSSTEIWATPFISNPSHFEKERKVDNANKDDNRNHLDLMDDFLEMEKLAHLSTESSNVISISSSPPEERTENEDDNSSSHVVTSGDLRSEPEFVISQLDNHILANVGSSIEKLEAKSKDGALGNLQDVKRVVQDIKGLLSKNSVNSTFENKDSPDESKKHQCRPQDIEENKESGSSLIQDGKPGISTEQVIDKKLVEAISQIRDFVTSLGKEPVEVEDNSSDDHGLKKRIEEFCVSINKLLSGEASVVDFVHDLSHVLAKISEARINQCETCSIDCKEKLNLLENKADQDGLLGEGYPNGCEHISRSTSDYEVLQEGCLSSGFEMNAASWRSLLEEKEQLQSEKDNMAFNLAKCTENLELTQFQLKETEHLEELKSQLESSKESNSLMETQLKCVAESYRSLETRARELDAEINILRGRAQTLEEELREEKQKHQTTLEKCKDFEKQMQQRNESCSKCSLSSAANAEIKSRQEKELAAATNKLVECQEAIFLLEKQLKALNPQQELAVEAPNNARHEPIPMYSSQDSRRHSEMKNSASSNIFKQGDEAPLDAFHSYSSPKKTEENHLMMSPIRSKSPKQKHTKSSSSSLSSLLTPEKHSYGFTRFFSPKKE